MSEYCENIILADSFKEPMQIIGGTKNSRLTEKEIFLGFGIDLILLYKCMLKHFVYRKLYNGRIVEDKFRYDESGFNGQYGIYDLKDYAKTWALTKEELE